MSTKVHAVILAGGKGTRLKPYTTFVPKPLMPIGDLPIIEVVLKQLHDAGVRSVTLAVGHLAQLIQAFVGDGSKYGLSIEYSYEENALGTAGPLGLLSEKLKRYDAFFTVNGDVLTTLNYKAALQSHLQRNADATICVNRRQVPIEFGVIRTTPDGLLEGYDEKPSLKFDVSMGVNLFSPRALEFIPSGRHFDIPHLMLALRDAGRTVHCFQEPCYWLDIGRVEDYQTACEIFETRRKEFLPNE